MILPWGSHVCCRYSPVPVFCMLRNNFQEDLFHDLTRHRCEADWSVGPRVLLITFFKNECDIVFSPVTGDFAWPPWIFKYDEEQLNNYICQLTWDSGMHLAGSHGFVMFRFLRSSWTCSFPKIGGTWFLHSLPWGSGTWEIWEEWLPVKTEAKKILEYLLMLL